jgi:OTU domain-containing protein 5
MLFAPECSTRGCSLDAGLPGNDFRVGHMVDVFEAARGRYFEGTVVDVRPDAVKVHFAGYASSLDEWVPIHSNRLHPWGLHSRTQHPYIPRARTYWNTTERKSQFTGSTDPRFAHYLSALSERHLRVQSMGGDGNCLFRSVAHQIYGDQELHTLTRRAAAAYMQANALWFRNFVVGDPAEFDQYIEHICTNAVWGDDPEIQALCELYDRPAEIWSYDPVSGAKKLRVFHSSRVDSRPPIRLSYYGGGHYDSVVGSDWEANLLRESPGEREDRIIAHARRRNDSVAVGGAIATLDPDAAALDAALDASRAAFDECDSNVDVALLLSMGVDPATAALVAPSESAGGIESAIVSRIIDETEAEATQRALLEQVQRQSEEEQLRLALSQSAAMQPTVEEDDEMAAAIAMSLGPAEFPDEPMLATGTDALYNAALDMTEEEQLHFLVTGVMPPRLQGGTQQISQAQGSEMSEEDMLQAAIARSLDN